MNNTLKKTFIAIEAVLYIACSSGAKPVRGKEICEYQGVSERYLEHILQRLVRDKILKGMRGPKGGYLLAKDRREIVLSDIYKVIKTLKDDDGEKPSLLSKTIVSPIMDDVEKNISEQLAKTTIQDLCEKAQKAKLPENLEKKTDFTI